MKLLLFAFVVTIGFSSIAFPGWFTPDTPEEKLVKAKEELNLCLTNAAKEARSDLGYRELALQCRKSFNLKREEIAKQIVDEVFSKANSEGK